MSYAYSGLPDYRTGLPTLADPGPYYPDSYINWDQPFLKFFPTYGHFGGPGFPSTGPVDPSIQPVNRMDGYFKTHDLAYDAAQSPEDFRAADLALIDALRGIF